MTIVQRKLHHSDEKILSGTFPVVPELDTPDCNIISNTFESCTFSLSIKTTLLPGYPKNVIVRRKLPRDESKNRLETLAALQNLAHSQLNDAVPLVLDAVTTTSAGAQEINYIVTELFMETPWRRVWKDTDQNN